MEKGNYKREEGEGGIKALDTALTALIGGIALAAYARTLAPGLLYGDSGELQVLAHTVGMTHPTGYPVYILIGKLFTLVLPGEIAWRVNMLSAFFGGIAVAGVYPIVRLLGGDNWASITGAVSLAISYTFWYQAVIAELYTPAAALTAIVILATLAWMQTGKPKWLLVAGVLGGLSIGVHASVTLAAPATLYILAVRRADKRAWTSALIGVLIGLALTSAAFWIVDTTNPPSAYYHATVEPSLSVWGISESDFNSFPERIWFLLSAKQFRPFMFTSTRDEVIARGREWLGLLGEREFSIPALILAALGLGSLLARRTDAGVFTLLIFTAHIFYNINYSVDDILVFYLPTYVIIASWVGIGTRQAIEWVEIALGHTGWQRAGVTAKPVLGVFILALVIWPFASARWDALEEGAACFIEDDYPMPLYNLAEPHVRAEMIVNVLDDGAILFTDWDLLYPLYYVAHVQQDRTDLTFHEAYPQDDRQYLADSAIEYIAANFDTRPIYVSERMPELRSLYRFRPVGHGSGIYRLSPLEE